MIQRTMPWKLAATRVHHYRLARAWRITFRCAGNRADRRTSEASVAPRGAQRLDRPRLMRTGEPDPSGLSFSFSGDCKRAMPILYRDIECRSTLLLASVGAWRYAADPSTEILCIGYAVDDAPVKIWTPNEPIPEEFFAAAREPDWLVVAHNDQFETALEERILAPRYGWPLIPIERHRCTMAASLANAMPGALDAAAAALGILVRKDAEGYRVMRQMSRPRKPRKGENPAGIYWHDDPERRAKLQAYCQRDTELERELYKRLPPLSDGEQHLWQLDALINKRGFYVDLALAEAAQKIVRAEQ